MDLTRRSLLASLFAVPLAKLWPRKQDEAIPMTAPQKREFVRWALSQPDAIIELFGLNDPRNREIIRQYLHAA